jgi:hypothetical protein
MNCIKNLRESAKSADKKVLDLLLKFHKTEKK